MKYERCASNVRSERFQGLPHCVQQEVGQETTVLQSSHSTVRNLFRNAQIDEELDISPDKLLE